MGHDGSAFPRWLWPWVWVVSFLLVFVAIHVVVQEEHLGREREAVRQTHLNMAAAQAAHQEWSKLDRLDRPGATAEEALSVLNGGRPFEPVPGGKDLYYWTDAAGGRVVLEISGGKWRRGVGWESPPMPRRSEGVMGVTNIIRRLFYFGLCGLWIVLSPLVAATWADRRARVRVAVHLLFIAISATALAMMGPDYWRAWNLFLYGDTAGWGLVLAGASVVILLVSRMGGRGDGVPRCGKCRYELTGNVSGVCPECGEVVPAEVRARILPVGVGEEGKA